MSEKHQTLLAAEVRLINLTVQPSKDSHDCQGDSDHTETGMIVHYMYNLAADVEMNRHNICSLTCHWNITPVLQK